MIGNFEKKIARVSSKNKEFFQLTIDGKTYFDWRQVSKDINPPALVEFNFKTTETPDGGTFYNIETMEVKGPVEIKAGEIPRGVSDEEWRNSVTEQLGILNNRVSEIHKQIVP